MCWVLQKSKQDLHQGSSSPGLSLPAGEWGGTNTQYRAHSLNWTVDFLQEHVTLPRVSSQDNIKTQHNILLKGNKIPALREPRGLILILLSPCAWRIVFSQEHELAEPSKV